MLEKINNQWKAHTAPDGRLLRIARVNLRLASGYNVVRLVRLSQVRKPDDRPNVHRRRQFTAIRFATAIVSAADSVADLELKTWEKARCLYCWRGISPRPRSLMSGAGTAHFLIF